MSKPKEHRFRAFIERSGVGLHHHVLPVPQAIADAIEAEGHRRVLLTIGQKTYRRALGGRKDGERLLVISQPMLRELGLRLGDAVESMLASDPDPEQIDIPEAFTEVLAQDPAAAERFWSFTPGRQRGLVHYVASAKRVDTQIKRSLELAEKIRTHNLYDDRLERDKEA